MLGRIGFLIRNPCPGLTSDENPEKCSGLGSDRKFFRKPSLYPLSYGGKGCFLRKNALSAEIIGQKGDPSQGLSIFPPIEPFSGPERLLLIGSVSFQLRSDPLFDL